MVLDRALKESVAPSPRSGRNGVVAPPNSRDMSVLAERFRSILDEAEQYPREDLLHSAAERLAELLARSPLVGELAEVKYDNTAVRHAVVLRALGYSSGAKDERFRIISKALTNPSVEVRDAAVSALTDLRDGRALPVLKAALPRETSPLIQQAIEDAITELREQQT